jgi:hypothetical protein
MHQANSRYVLTQKSPSNLSHGAKSATTLKMLINSMKDDDLFPASMDILSIIVGHLCHMDMVEDSLTANAVAALLPIPLGLLPWPWVVPRS